MHALTGSIAIGHEYIYFLQNLLNLSSTDVIFYVFNRLGRVCFMTRAQIAGQFQSSQPWTLTALETSEYSTHVLKVKLFFQHLINNVKTHPNLCPVVGCLYLKHENKDKNLITSFPINCGIFLSTDFRRVHVYCTQ
jgi:hypothetical protein